MKILMVCQYYYPEQFRINDICETLVKRNHEVTVLTGLPNYPTGVIPTEYKWLKKRKETVNGVKIIRSYEARRRKGSIGLFINYLSFMVSASFKVLFMKKDFDVVFINQLSPIIMAIPALLVKKLTKIKCYLYCLDLWPASLTAGNIKKNTLMYKIIKKVSKFIYRNCDQIAVTSRRFKNYFKNELDLDITVNYLPQYAESIFELNDATIQNKVKNTIDLVFAGNIGKMQSVETILLAAHELKQHTSINFHIFGDGTNLTKCKEIVKIKILNNVKFYGQKPLNEMPAIYAMADAMLITLKDDKFLSNTLPGKVPTYMAAAKPIIGAINGETMDIIQLSRCGYCVPAEDFKALAKVILEFAQNKDMRREFSENSFNYYKENFIKDIFINNLENHLEGLIRKEEQSV